MTDLLSRLEQDAVLLSDGAMGTQLFNRGLKPGECPEALNLTHPEYLEQIAASYAQAGADIVHTNTFGGSPAALAAYGLDNQTEQINRAAVETARRGAGPDALISGSCGPSGKLLEPLGDGDPAQIKAGFKRQLEALLEGGVDAITVETMTDLNEAILAVEAVRELDSTVPVMATMTFDESPRGFYTIMGVTIDQATAGLAAAGAQVIGSNCGDGLEKMARLAPLLAQATSLPVMIQSNAGQPKMTTQGPVWSESPEFFADRVLSIVRDGVSIIGGCCGTGPEHIRAIRTALDNRA